MSGPTTRTIPSLKARLDLLKHAVALPVRALKGDAKVQVGEGEDLRDGSR